MNSFDIFYLVHLENLLEKYMHVFNPNVWNILKH